MKDFPEKDFLVEEILRLKKEKNAVILAHNYQLPEVQDIADVVGDSLELARAAVTRSEEVIIFCGVHFMAEGAKILNPDKRVFLPRIEAGCFMTEMMEMRQLLEMKREYPGAVVVAYVNTTAEMKAHADVCCTSANAVKVIQNIPADEIIFVPDRNLAHYAQRFTDKKIYWPNSFCYVHQKFSREEVEKARQDHPDAIIVVHPECPPEVIDMADEVRSTGGMVRLPGEVDAKEFVIGTEEGLIYRLRRENPDRTFYPLGPARICVSMKITRLEDVLASLKESTFEIHVPEDIAARARVALERMLEYV